VPISITSHRPCELTFADVHYDFLSFLPCTERLASKGPRLHATADQRQSKVYGPDKFTTVTVEEAGQRLSVEFVEDEPLVLAQGESRRLDMWLSNSGTKPISELWLLADVDDVLWTELNADHARGGPFLSLFPCNTTISYGLTITEVPSRTEVLQSDNCLLPKEPLRIPFECISDSSTLISGRDARLSVRLHADRPRDQDLTLLFVYREASLFPVRSHVVGS
jgi:trafficking protein particle complex subunit 8